MHSVQQMDQGSEATTRSRMVTSGGVEGEDRGVLKSRIEEAACGLDENPVRAISLVVGQRARDREATSSTVRTQQVVSSC